jgi:hypothetical protein
VLIELSYHILNGETLRNAALRVNWSRIRRRLGEHITELEEMPSEKHSKTFLILLFVTILQALKLFGIHGLFWTKVWAGIYLSSYAILAGWDVSRLWIGGVSYLRNQVLEARHTLNFYCTH